MMSEVLSYLIMITCILIRVSSKEVKWTVRDTPPKLGQDLTLFCKVDNCTVPETKRWHGGPDDKVLMLNSGISTDKTKYSTSIEKNGFILTILNLTVKDLNISYTCSCGLDLDDHILYIEDVYTVDNLNKTTNGTNYIGTNDLGGISLYVYIAIPVAILVILLIIVIVVSKRHWLSRRLNGKTDDTEKSNTEEDCNQSAPSADTCYSATENHGPSASWKDSEEDCNQSAPSADTCYSATESLDPSASRKDSERVNNSNMKVSLLSVSNPGQSSGNMNQVPPGSYSQPSSLSLKQDILRPQSEKTSFTNKPEINRSEIKNHPCSSKGDNPNDTSALQQAIEMLEDQNRKLDEELEFYKSHQTDNMGPCHTDTEKQVEELQSDNNKIQKKIYDLKRTNDPTSDLFRLSTQEQQQLQDDLVKLNSEIRIFDKKNSELRARHREEVSELKKNNQRLSQKVHSLEVQYQNLEPELEAALQAAADDKKKTVADVGETMKSSMHNLQSQYDVMCQKVVLLKSLYSNLTDSFILIEKQAKQFPELLKKTVTEVTIHTIKAITEYNKELVKKYYREMRLRRKYHNELVELKGKIRVFCRVRSKIKEDGDGPMANIVVEYDQDNDGLIYVSNKTHQFEVDKVFKQGSLQEEVFDEVKALITSCIDGYNVCIFAYGQTGSGKTFTMEGSPSDPGIYTRALKALFNEASAKGDDWSFTITVSFIEIYNEMIRDLLNYNLSNKMEVKMNQDRSVYVPGLSLVVVKTMEDVNEQVLDVGKQNRVITTTEMNEHSSRSHALLCVTVTGFNKTTKTKTMGKLNLVDLAGSESVSQSKAVGERLEETKHINTSLFCIRNTLHALISKQSYVPYRNSKLTHVLQDSLGSGSKTLMIVQVAPVEKNMAETISSLTFAQSVRAVELGQASKKRKSGDVEMDPVHTTVRQQQRTPKQSMHSKGSTPVAAKYPRRK